MIFDVGDALANCTAPGSFLYHLLAVVFIFLILQLFVLKISQNFEWIA